MNITLRKANTLQNSINDAIRSLKVVTSIELNEFQNARPEIDAAVANITAVDKKREALLGVLFNIRNKVAIENAATGINSKLTRAAYIDKRIAQLTEIASAVPATGISVVEGQISKMRNRKEDMYGRDSIAVQIVPSALATEVKSFIKKLKKERQQINDEVLELNVKTEISLSDVDIEVLECEGIV